MQSPESRQGRQAAQAQGSEFVDSLKTGALIGLAVLVLVLPPMWLKKNRDAQLQAQRAGAVAPLAGEGAQRSYLPPARLADFRGEDPSPEARLVANWVVHTRNHKRHAFVIVDKKDARVYVFGPDGRLKDSAPALLGQAHGDDTYPGVGEKPLSQVRPEEKTTPAGRFVAEIGLNAGNEDVVWVDYKAAVSMHRVRPLSPREHRLERLASLTTDDNRISFGCINLPVSFYENVLHPTVKRHGAIVYVLPEVKTPQEVFGAYDVTDPIQLAAAHLAQAAALQRVSLQQTRSLQTLH